MPVLLLLAALGCSQQSRKNFAWPWAPEVDDAVGITTPAQRLAAMKEMAEKADKQSPAEQERVSADLAKQIQEEQDPMIRRNIVKALGHFNTASSTAVLQAAVADSDAWVRVAACEAWGRRGGPESVERLATLLSADTNLDVRLAAAHALGQTRIKGPTAALGRSTFRWRPRNPLSRTWLAEKISGKDYGNDPNLWRAYARGENPDPPSGPSIARAHQEAVLNCAGPSGFPMAGAVELPVLPSSPRLVTPGIKMWSLVVNHPRGRVRYD